MSKTKKYLMEKELISEIDIQDYTDAEFPQPLNKQVGGDHYKKYKIQPVEYIYQNGIPFIEGCIIKYATRWKDKGGLADIDKIIHFAELLRDQYRKDLDNQEPPF